MGAYTVTICTYRYTRLQRRGK